MAFLSPLSSVTRASVCCLLSCASPPSQPSAPVYPKYPNATQPPGVPLDAAIVSVGVHAAEVCWQSPLPSALDAGPVLRYLVSVAPASNASKVAVTPVDSGMCDRVSALAAGTGYLWSVAAVNSAGTGM